MVAWLGPVPLVVVPLLTADALGLTSVPAPVVKLVPAVALVEDAVAVAAAWKALKTSQQSVNSEDHSLSAEAGV